MKSPSKTIPESVSLVASSFQIPSLLQAWNITKKAVSHPVSQTVLMLLASAGAVQNIACKPAIVEQNSIVERDTNLDQLDTDVQSVADIIEHIFQNHPGDDQEFVDVYHELGPWNGYALPVQIDNVSGKVMKITPDRGDEIYYRIELQSDDGDSSREYSLTIKLYDDTYKHWIDPNIEGDKRISIESSEGEIQYYVDRNGQLIEDCETATDYTTQANVKNQFSFVLGALVNYKSNLDQKLSEKLQSNITAGLDYTPEGYDQISRDLNILSDQIESIHVGPFDQATKTEIRMDQATNGPTSIKLSELSDPTGEQLPHVTFITHGSHSGFIASYPIGDKVIGLIHTDDPSEDIVLKLNIGDGSESSLVSASVYTRNNLQSSSNPFEGGPTDSNRYQSMFSEASIHYYVQEDGSFKRRSLPVNQGKNYSLVLDEITKAMEVLSELEKL